MRAGRLLKSAPATPAEHLPRIEVLLAAPLLGHDAIVRRSDGRRGWRLDCREADGEQGAGEHQRHERHESDPRKA